MAGPSYGVAPVPKTRHCNLGLTLLFLALAVGGLYFAWRLAYAPGDAVIHALRNHGKNGAGANELVQALIQNYDDTRTNATQWSGVLWGFSFGSLIASAMAGVVLKVESVGFTEARRKDVAALLSLVAAVLAGMSTTGGFHVKWQANRLAAAKLEQLGYTFLADKTPDLPHYYTIIGEIQYERTTIITGNSDSRFALGKASGENLDEARRKMVGENRSQP